MQRFINISKFSYPLIQSLLLNYLLLNAWLIQNKNIRISNYSDWVYSDPPLWVFFVLINLVILSLFLFGRINLNNNISYFLLAIFVFQIFNINKIPANYFWETVPDSISYRYLGETLFSCGKLALSCESNPFLQWPIGQPVISGLLSIYFYDFAKYIYLSIFMLAIYFIGELSRKKFGNFYVYGIIYFSLMQNNYELSSLIISEIPYMLLSVGMINFLDKNRLNISFLLGFLSLLVRPIGIINIVIFFIYLIVKKKYLIYKFLLLFLICFLLVMSFNLMINESFVFSTTVSTNISGDGIQNSSSTLEYAINLFSIESLEEIYKNIQELYGKGSRDCKYENCFIYNPLFNKDGTVPQTLNENSFLGRVLNPIMSNAFKIASPLGIWVYVPFLFIFCINRKFSIDNLIFLMFLLNIMFSVLTNEYGSRWWLLPNLLSMYLLSALSFKVFNRISRK